MFRKLINKSTVQYFNAIKLNGHNCSKVLYRQISTNNNGLTPKLKVAKYDIPILKKVFGKYLLVTNIVSSGVLLAGGDFVLQYIDIKRMKTNKYDIERLGRMLFVGFLLGPLHHYFYKWLDIAFVDVTLKNTSIKIFLDQIIMSPACIALFMYSACFLENKNFAESNTELKAKFLTIYMADWAIWPAAQYLNFRYLSTKYRVIYINFVTMIYNVFLSYIKHDT